MAEFEELVGADAIREEFASAEVKAAEIEFAEQAAEYWRSISPVGRPGDPHPGRYRDSISVVVEGDDVLVVAADESANLIEYGSIHNEEYAPRAKTEAHFNNDNESRR